jgi:hypothetical protein
MRDGIGDRRLRPPLSNPDTTMRGHRSRRSTLALALLLGTVGASSLDRVATPAGDGPQHGWSDALPGATWAAVAPSAKAPGGAPGSDGTDRHVAPLTQRASDEARATRARRIVHLRGLGGWPSPSGARLLGLPGYPAQAPPRS